ncbi:MAG: Fe-S cluster assembly protein SufD [Chloroflexi bacterium]|nr:Fe-S cluster assembly protein SufD [Chloroflexota bacterium]
MGRRRIVKEVSIPLTRDHVIAVSEQVGDPEWMREKRLAAWDIYEATPLPTVNDEAWRRTDIRGLDWESALKVVGDSPNTLDNVPEELYKPLIGEKQGGLMVFVNGSLVHYEVAAEIKQQGVIFTDLANAAHEHVELLQQFYMTSAVQAEDGKFAALQAAMWTHGVFVYVPKGVQVELPLHSLEYADSNETTFMHILVALDEDASLTYLHESASPTGETQMVHIGATELLVDQSANLRYVALQNWGDNVWNFGHQRGLIYEGGQLDWVVGEMGTRLSKVFQTIDLMGDDSWGRISGLFFAHGRQHIDLDTQQNHRALRTTSDLLYKGALRDKSRTVWQGMIAVDPGAQKTDGFQANRNLLLDRTARADSIPGLEIQADDVACTHASTIGKVDETEIFYLMSRGIPRIEATKLIVRGFFDPVMQRIPFEEVRERLGASIEEKLLHA